MIDEKAFEAKGYVLRNGVFEKVGVSPRSAAPAPNAKRDVVSKPLAAAPAKKAGSGRLHIRITQYRSRLIDPDGAVEKYAVDMLRYCGLLEDDTAKHVTYQVSQEKVSKGQEKTVIKVYAE